MRARVLCETRILPAPKGRLQEIVQPVHGNDALRYEVTRTEGADHQREYEDITGMLGDAEIPFFGAPGNHDGYAKFESENDFTSPLQRDGLNYWRAFIGPTYYSFKLFGKTLMMLNTYDGTAERRASGDPIGIGDNAVAPVSLWR